MHFRRIFSAGRSLLLLRLLLAISCRAGELKEETVQAFDRYLRVTEARMDAELGPDGAFLWVDALPYAHRQRFYKELRQGQLEIRRLESEEDGKSIAVPDGLIHHWSGVEFVPNVSLGRAVSLLQDYDNHWRIYKPYVRRSKLLEDKDDTFKVYFQFYRESPRRASFDAEFEVRYTRIDSSRVASRAVSTRIAELEHPGRPDSTEFPVGQGRGYLWRINNYWRVWERDGGVYIQVEIIALSRGVPVLFAWLVHPLIRRVSRETMVDLLDSTRKGLQNPPGPQVIRLKDRRTIEDTNYPSNFLAAEPQ